MKLQPYPSQRKTVKSSSISGFNLQPNTSQAELNSPKWSLTIKPCHSWKPCTSPALPQPSACSPSLPWCTGWRAHSWEAQQPRGCQDSWEFNLHHMSKVNQHDKKNRARCCSPDRCLVSDASHSVQPSHMCWKSTLQMIYHITVPIELKSPLKFFHLILMWSSLTFSTLLFKAVLGAGGNFHCPLACQQCYPPRRRNTLGTNSLSLKGGELCIHLCIALLFVTFNRAELGSPMQGIMRQWREPRRSRCPS